MGALVDNTMAILVAQIKAVQQEFPHASFVWESVSIAYFQWLVSTQMNRDKYQMRLYLNPALPEVCPALYAWSPIGLRRFQGGTLNEIGAKASSHEFHILRNGPGNRVQICHSAPSDWSNVVSYVLPILKSFIWCEGYEAHLRDGSSIASYFEQETRAAW